MRWRNMLLAALISTVASFAQPVTRDAPFQVGYAANLDLGEAWINITNTGANGASLLGPGFGRASGNICVNVYALSPDEQLISCCSCLVTPNAVVSVGVNRDLTSRTLTGVIPTSIVVKLLATLAGDGGGGGSSACSNSAATVGTGTIAAGIAAHAHKLTITKVLDKTSPLLITEVPFRAATLSAGELASLGGRCASILGNGSGFGVCRSCQAGALGAAAK